MRFLAAVLLGLLPYAVAAQPSGGFKHIVLVIQENRTPDDLFGSNPVFEPNVDLATMGLNSHNRQVTLTPEPIDGCYDLGHSISAFVSMYDNGAMNGADLILAHPKNGCTVPKNPQFKFADNSTGTVQPYFDIAKSWGFANRMFQTNEGSSYPAHQFLFGGTAAPTATSPLFVAGNLLHNSWGVGCMVDSRQRINVIDQHRNTKSHPRIYPCYDRQTLVDLLDAAGLTWKYYNNVGKPGSHHWEMSVWNAPSSILRLCEPTGQGRGQKCGGRNYVGHVVGQRSQILVDVKNCRLPAVSWVTPSVLDSDHPGNTGPTGPAWVASIVNAIGQQPACGSETYWNDTAILVTWDDWGGWYDHVPPFAVKNAGSGWGAGYVYGFRVPLLVVSAYTPPGTVDNVNHDFGSLLRFVEENFSLGLIGSGQYADAYATDLSGFFKPSKPRGFAPVAAKWGADYFLRAVRPADPPEID